MHISFSPQRCDDVLAVSKAGDVLTINGEAFDFSDLPDDAEIVEGDVPCVWLAGPVRRTGGALHLTLLLPHGPNPPTHVAYPGHFEMNGDGPVPLPTEQESNHVEG